jgi:hypothetical protein
MYLAKVSVRRADGSKRFYYVLRHTEWSKTERRPIQRYLGYIGPKPVITLEKAQALCQKLGIGLIDLQNVKGLQIIDDLTVEGPFGERVSKS